MQIVIDIDDNLYTRLFDNGENYVADMRRACVAIRNGTPLDDKVSLKLRGKGYVLYNYDWLKEHIDMEAKIIKGAMI